MFDFQKNNSLEARCGESKRIIEKYPDRIPIIVEVHPKSDIPKLTKNKFLVPKEITMGQFLYIIRKRISLPPEKALFLFVNNIIPKTSCTITELYKEQKESDNFLYIHINGENTFGKSI